MSSLYQNGDEFDVQILVLPSFFSNHPRFSAAKVRGGQANKLVEVQGFEIYCTTDEGNDDVNILAPVDVSISLLVCIFFFPYGACMILHIFAV